VGIPIAMIALFKLLHVILQEARNNPHVRTLSEKSIQREKGKKSSERREKARQG
jgi:hypothetical protein